MERLYDEYPLGVVGTEHSYVEYTVKQITRSTTTQRELACVCALEYFAMSLPIHPTSIQGRIMQQDARFTLDMPFLEKNTERQYVGDCPPYYASDVTKYRIPRDRKSVILKELENVGISGVTVYYDLESLAKSLKKKHRIGVEEEPVSEQEKS